MKLGKLKIKPVGRQIPEKVSLVRHDKMWKKTGKAKIIRRK